LKVVFAAGGTGGHISPALALYQILFSEGGDGLFLSSFRSVPNFAGCLPAGRLVRIPSYPLRWRKPWQFLKLFSLNCMGYRKSLRTLREFGPDVLVATGGYPSVPPVLAARRLGISIVLYEANTIPGRANRYLSHIATGMLRALPPDSRYSLKIPQIRVSPAIPEAACESAPASITGEWNLKPGVFTILVMGGSHGALAINRIISKCLQAWTGYTDKLQFIHLCGKGMEEEVRAAYHETGFRARIIAFTEKIGWLYSLSDLVISRAGAATVAEIIHWGIPAILVPYPYAVDGHQLANAKMLEDSGAGKVCIEDEQAPEMVARMVINILADRLSGVKVDKVAGRADLVQARAPFEVIRAVGRGEPDAFGPKIVES